MTRLQCVRFPRALPRVVVHFIATRCASPSCPQCCEVCHISSVILTETMRLPWIKRQRRQETLWSSISLFLPIFHAISHSCIFSTFSSLPLTLSLSFSHSICQPFTLPPSRVCPLDFVGRDLVASSRPDSNYKLMRFRIIQVSF